MRRRILSGNLFQTLSDEGPGRTFGCSGVTITGKSSGAAGSSFAPSTSEDGFRSGGIPRRRLQIGFLVFGRPGLRSEEFVQMPRARGGAQLAQRLGLDLPDPLAGQDRKSTR